MYAEIDPSAKMQVRSQGQLQAPGSCMVCGTGTCDAGYLDLGIFIDYVGTAYLCKTCCYQAGETFGMFTPDEVNTSSSQISALLQENAELKTELEDARKFVAAADDLLRSRFSSGGVVTDTPHAESGAVLAVINSPADDADAGEPVLTEPTPIRRRGNSSGSEPRNPSL